MIWLPPAISSALRGNGWPVIVTGAGGWLGQAALAALNEAFGETLPGRVQAFSTAPRHLVLAQGRTILTRPFAELETLSTPPACILHFAFRTKGHAAEPFYAETNRRIAATMRGFIERNGAHGLFIPSSGAIYGPRGEPHQNLAQDPYGALKYEDEQSFAALAQQLGIPAVIMRIFNLAGPCMNNLSGYALACIISDILSSTTIALRAVKPVWRSYAHVGDVLAIALSLLLRGESPQPFDTAGERPVEIGELASLAARLLSGAECPLTRPRWQDATPDRYLGNFKVFQKTARLAGVTLRPLETQILDTADYIRRLNTLSIAPGRRLP